MQEWTRRAPDRNADLAEADRSASSSSGELRSQEHPFQEGLSSSLPPHSVPGRGCREAEGPEGAAAGGWRLHALLAAKQSVISPSKHELHISMGATAFKHLCSKNH